MTKERKDATFIAMGYMVSEAIKAVGLLEKEGLTKKRPCDNRANLFQSHKKIPLERPRGIFLSDFDPLPSFPEMTYTNSKKLKSTAKLLYLRTSIQVSAGML